MTHIAAALAEGSALAVRATCRPPTVTMPRLKALTSGTIPGFVDIALNFGATQLVEDNLISQLESGGRRMLFYGDETWLKLFPDHFVRSDGTSSFFVSDYTEVDHNVTRHLSSELKRDDWDVMILHYLGLDHIGHQTGPSSPLVVPKLREMDEVIRGIEAELVKKSEDYVVVVCGDHGMSDQGSHGGASTAEVETPLIFMSPKMRSFPRHKTLLKAAQLDVAPTLSVLLGVPIPRNSLGVIIAPMLNMMPHWKHRLNAIAHNAEQMVRLLEVHLGNTEKNAVSGLFQQVRRVHAAWSSSDANQAEYILQRYVHVIAEAQAVLSKSLNQYDMGLIVCGLLLLWMSLLGFLKIDAIVVPPSALLPGVLSAVFLVAITFLSASVLEWWWMGTLLLTAAVLWLLITSLMHGAYRLRWVHLRTECAFDRVCVLVLALHPLTWSSSSFVEEEHLVVYFLSTSLLFLLLLRSAGRGLIKDGSSLSSWLLLLCAYRLARSWNQTGDKWLNLPDIGDWLNRDASKPIKSVLVLVSLLGIRSCIATENAFQKGITALLAGLCYLQKAATGELVAPELVQGCLSKSGAREARLYYLLVAAFAVHRVQHCSVPKVCRCLEVCFQVWTLLWTLLMRSHNIPLVFLVQCQLSSLGRISLQWESSAVLAAVTALLGRSAYFQQGLSNSISSLDVSSGYIGLDSYTPSIVLFLMGIAAMGGPVACYLKVMQSIPSTSQRAELTWTLLTSFAFAVALFSTLMTLERYHLFIWSVFSPKCLFLTAANLIFHLVIIAVSFVDHSNRME